MTSLPCSFCCFIINMSFHLLSSSSYDFCLSLLCLALIYAITKQSSSSGERFSQNKGLSVNQTSLTEEPLHSVTLHSLPVFLRVVLKTTTTTTTSKGIQFKQMISSASILSEFDFPDKSTCNLDKRNFPSLFHSHHQGCKVLSTFLLCNEPLKRHLVQIVLHDIDDSDQDLRTQL